MCSIQCRHVPTLRPSRDVKYVNEGGGFIFGDGGLRIIHMGLVTKTTDGDEVAQETTTGVKR